MPSMAARPLVISAAGVKGPKASFLVPFKIGTKLAMVKRRKVPKMRALGPSETCWATVSWEANSAPMAAKKPSMANLPLMISGAEPEKAMASPMDGAAGVGVRVGGVGGIAVAADDASTTGVAGVSSFVG
jgi:hypothetical protein